MSFLKSTMRTALRIFVALLFIAVPLIVFKLAVLPALGLARDLPATEAITQTPVSFYFNVGITALISVLGFWAYVRLIEHRPVEEYAFRGRALLAGIASGLFLIGLPIAILYFTGNYEMLAYQGVSAATAAVAIVVFAAVLLEEIIFRGIIFATIERHFGTIAALLLQSALFSAVHLANDNWAGIMPVVSGFLIGCLWTCLYIVVRNIWVVTAHHAVWNLAIFATGLPLSGIDEWRAAALFQSEFHGPVLLTGGISGPEVSILTPAVVLVAFAGLSYWAIKKQRLLRAWGHAPVRSAA